MRCATCADEVCIKKNEYRIIERGHTGRLRFCSLKCVDAYLAHALPDWFARGIHSFVSENSDTNMHEVRIKPRSSWNPYRDPEMIGH